MIPVIPHPTRTVVGAAGALALGPDSSVRAEEPVLAGIAQRFVDDVVDDTGLHLILGGGPSASSIVLSLVGSLSVEFPPPLGLSPDGGDPVNESYRLTVTATGVTVEALVPTGIVRGLATLRQLISASLTEDATALLDEVLIDDSPRFAWRGLSLDVVRTFFSTEQIRRVLDAMALFKMNVLHLHLSDDQGWRIEIPRWPELTEAGADGAMGDRPGGYYTRHEFAELVTYAADRSIVILPEIDMPGHSGAVLRAYPELTSSMGPNLLDPNHPGVLEFASDVIAALAQIAPGPFVHLGGDEAFGMQPEAYATFVDAARTLAVAAGLRPIFWQEASRSSLGSSDIIQHWMALDPEIEALLLSGDLGDLAEGVPEDLGIPTAMLTTIAEMFRIAQTDVARAIERGAKVILSPASHLYLDRPYAEEPLDPTQHDLHRRLGLKVYPRRTIAESFDWDPVEALGEHPEAIAGVEAALWCETIATIDELEFMLLPRLAGVAERAWASGPGASWAEYRLRLGPQAPLWHHRGWQFFTSSLVDWATSPTTEDIATP